MEWDYGEKCVVCGSPYVEHHHVFYGTANRRISDKYGYIIPLCNMHHTGPMGIHNDKLLRRYWEQIAQKHFEENYGTREDFIKIFGRNYIE